MERNGRSGVDGGIFCVGKVETEQKAVHAFKSNGFSFVTSRGLWDCLGNAFLDGRQHIGAMPISTLKYVPPFDAR
jgi:hypothetical protein